jgi:hypothetical protein
VDWWVRNCCRMYGRAGRWVEAWANVADLAKRWPGPSHSDQLRMPCPLACCSVCARASNESGLIFTGHSGYDWNLRPRMVLYTPSFSCFVRRCKFSFCWLLCSTASDPLQATSSGSCWLMWRSPSSLDAGPACALYLLLQECGNLSTPVCHFVSALSITQVPARAGPAHPPLLGPGPTEQATSAGTGARADAAAVREPMSDRLWTQAF